MAIKSKKPPIKETVGSQYFCYDTPGEDSNDFVGNFNAEVVKTDVVKSISVTENGDTQNVYASGNTYDSITDTTTIDTEVEVVAFPMEDLYKMRGDTVTATGAILAGAPSERPYFAYGKVVKLRGGNYRYVWYPKSKLISNTDDISTKEESFSEQNDTVTIRHYPFDADGNIEFKVDSTVKVPNGLTEAKFFAKPLMTDDDLKSAIGGAE